ncbi:MAG: metallophosphatase domain-containing protein [Verrucomicrobia bacterium]|nr:metallophosphatase domain-containing protein [Cytophagales bacterium]
MKIVCISDTHSHHLKVNVPEGDLLLHAGDITKRGTEGELAEFNYWIGTLPHKHKIIIAGNHDFICEEKPEVAESLITNAIYLNDSGVEIEGLKIWGSPISPFFHDWAFNRQRGEDIKKHWDLIPIGTDILITHGPPKDILDKTFLKTHVGCEDLLHRIMLVKPKIHLFGHIHEAYGQTYDQDIQFINASIMNLAFQPKHLPIVLEI